MDATEFIQNLILHSRLGLVVDETMKFITTTCYSVGNNFTHILFINALYYISIGYIVNLDE